MIVKELNSLTKLLLIIFFIGVVILYMFISPKLNYNEKNGKSERLNYYHEHKISLIGKVKEIKYLSRGCLLYVHIVKSNTEKFEGFKFGDGTRDLVINNDQAILCSDYRDLIKNEDSVVVVLNEGVFKIYRHDLLIVDQGFQYFKNGRATE